MDELTFRLDRKDPYLRLQHVAVFVRDQDRSVRFYVDQLGFSLVTDVRLDSGYRSITVAPPDGAALLSLVAPKPSSEEYKLIGKPTHVVFVTEDVMAKFREWSKRGVRFLRVPRLKRVTHEAPGQMGAAAPPLSAAGDKAIWGGVFARFQDVDGNSFGLVSFDHLSREIEAQRRAVAEKLEAERRSAQELEIAKQVQARLFPQMLPPLKTLDYAGACIQARQVGGDYYDFLHLGRERLGLVIGDISGKGMAAALLMANLQANLRSQCVGAADQPQRFLRSVNQLFCENTPEGSYATLFFAEYDDRARCLRYANCGHVSALLLRGNGAVEQLDSTGTVLGIWREWDCSLGERQLSSADTLAIYTDGITESFNDAGEEFGEQRLIESLQRYREQPSPALIASVIDDVRKFSPSEQADDITLIVAKAR